MKEKKQVCNQLQARHLRDRVQIAQSKHRTAIYDGAQRKDPPNIAAARALVKKFDNERYRAEQKATESRMARMKADAEKAQQAVLFELPTAALKIVEAFEQRKYV